MPTPRKNIVSLEATPYYHCIGRCVRRAFLWGTDTFSGQDFSHRKAWVVERLAELSQVFAIDICAYAVMSNHYHLVLHVDPARAQDWSETDIASRWGSLFLIPSILLKYLNETRHDPAELPVVMALLNKLRQRLCDLSWFMRCLNEPLARRANLEDNCKGRFWEGRFKSQAILDEAGLLSCCAYVDLNPVRAGVSQTPEESEFTSIQQRIREFSIAKEVKYNADSGHFLPAFKSAKDLSHPVSSLQKTIKPQNHPVLYPFSNPLNSAVKHKIPYDWSDYLELINWVSRVVRTDQKQSVSTRSPPILNRLGFTSETFMYQMREHALHKGTVLGSLENLRHFADILHQKYVKGISMPDMQFSGGF